jgi:hypothetical protein
MKILKIQNRLEINFQTIPPPPKMGLSFSKKFLNHDPMPFLLKKPRPNGSCKNQEGANLGLDGYVQNLVMHVENLEGCRTETHSFVVGIQCIRFLSFFHNLINLFKPTNFQFLII